MKIEEISKILFQSAAEGLIVIGKNEIIQIANPSAEAMFGYEKKMLVGKTASILLAKKDQEKFAEIKGNYYSNPRKLLFEAEGKRKDGQIIPIEISLNHFFLKGELIIMVLITDISKRKKMIYDLKREKETAQMYLDLAGSMFILIDKNKEVKLINKKGCELLECEEKDVLGKNWIKHFIPENFKQNISDVFDQFISGENQDYKRHKNPIVSTSGQERMILWSNVILKNSQGEVSGVLSSGEDITEHVKTQKKLLELNSQLEKNVEERTKELDENQRLYRMIARNFPNGVINVLDRELKYVFVEGKELYKRGIIGDMLIGTNYLDQISDEIQDQLKEKLLKVFEGSNVNFELVIEGKTYMINAVALPDLENNINQILVVSQNISSLKEAELEIQNSLKKEKKLNELKSSFVSIASHEFRTPLSSILNSVRLLSKAIQNQKEIEKQDKNVNRIINSVHYLNNILNDFLSLDKLETGGITINSSKISIPEFMQDIKEEMKGIAKTGQEINYTHSGDKQITIDSQITRNILNNLLSNAIKYSGENTSIIFTTQVDEEKLHIVVQDFGIGISKEDQHHLFERFFRAKNAVTIRGTGLGLNIVKRYLNIIQGEISFSSEINKGTTFRVEIPRLDNPKQIHYENNSINRRRFRYSGDHL